MNTVEQILALTLAGNRLSPEDALRLYREATLNQLGQAAQARRFQLNPKPQVSFVIDRNVNYTNACTAACRFCAFAFWPTDKRVYLLPYQEIQAKVQELVEVGGTQLLLQGGHNPDCGIEYYEELFRSLKRDFPSICLHSLSPSEIDHICETSKVSLKECLERLIAAGWDSFPGGGAEILVDRVRNILSPLKTSSDRWLEIMREAHLLGLQGSATMMYGHVETIAERIEHLSRIRNLQDETGGFRAFVAWSFQAGDTPLAGDPRLLEGEGRADAEDYLRTQALARLFLDNIPHIQVSWVTQGLDLGQVALHFGADDFGGTMMEENVVSAAGTKHSKSHAGELRRIILGAGFEPVQRDTYYGEVGHSSALSASSVK